MVAKKAKTNLDTGMLGILATVFMIVDHVGAAFFPGRDFIWMRVIGRIAFPLFAWGIAVGAEHTRNIGRYALRLFLLIFISQPFFMLGLGHSALDLNIFATLFLGLIGIWGLKERKEWMTVLAVLLSYLISIDYGIRGVMCILMLWAVRENPLALSVCFSIFCVTVWGRGYTPLVRTPYFTITLQMSALLALPFMLYPTAKRTRTPRWLMYSIYPVHLAVIWLVKLLLR